MQTSAITKASSETETDTDTQRERREREREREREYALEMDGRMDRARWINR
jgi:hypothetical protein